MTNEDYSEQVNEISEGAEIEFEEDDLKGLPFTMLDSNWAYARIEPDQKAMMITLIIYAWGGNRKAFPSYTTLAKCFNRGVTATKRVVRELETIGLLRRVARYQSTAEGKVKQTSNLFKLRFVCPDELINWEAKGLHSEGKEASTPRLESDSTPVWNRTPPPSGIGLHPRLESDSNKEVLTNNDLVTSKDVADATPAAAQDVDVQASGMVASQPQSVTFTPPKEDVPPLAARRASSKLTLPPVNQTATAAEEVYRRIHHNPASEYSSKRTLSMLRNYQVAVDRGVYTLADLEEALARARDWAKTNKRSLPGEAAIARWIKEVQAETPTGGTHERTNPIRPQPDSSSRGSYPTAPARARAGGTAVNPRSEFFQGFFSK